MHKSNLYTKVGDKSTTKIFNDICVTKNSALINAIGNIDELSSSISIIYNYDNNPEIKNYLLEIQNTLQTLNSQLAGCAKNNIKPEEAKKIENIIDKLSEKIEPNNKFLLLNNTLASAFCNFTRTIARRAERSIVDLSAQQNVSPEILTYMNRLADLFFIIARVLDGKQA